MSLKHDKCVGTGRIDMLCISPVNEILVHN